MPYHQQAFYPSLTKLSLYTITLVFKILRLFYTYLTPVLHSCILISAPMLRTMKASRL